MVSSDLEKILRKEVFEADSVALAILTKLKAAEYLYDHDQYIRIFGLCRLLGLTQLFDIGCGNQLQVCLIVDFPAIFYVGIDCDEKYDFTHVNDLFAQEGRIKFNKIEYPYKINSTNNNIAVSLECLGTLIDKKSIKKATVALSRDFERILLTINSCFDIWETELSAYNLHTIYYDASNNYRVVFGTKFPEEISKLEKIGYDYCDERFTSSAFNVQLIL